MPRGKEQKCLSKDVTKWKLEFQVSVWGVCEANSSGAWWKHSPAHAVYLQDRSSGPRAALWSWGVQVSSPGKENLGELSSQRDLRGGAGKEVPQDHLFVSLCENAYLAWQALPSLS